MKHLILTLVLANILFIPNAFSQRINKVDQMLLTGNMKVQFQFLSR